MSREEFPEREAVARQGVSAIQEGIPEAERPNFDEFDSLPDEALMVYGVSSEEGRQVVTFGNYSSSLARLLEDDVCPFPFGERLKQAHATGGVQGVHDVVGAMNALLGTDISLQIAPKSDERYVAAGVDIPVKKN